MQSPGTPSIAERAIRRQLETRFITLYAFMNNCKTPSREQIDHHVDYEMHLSKVFRLSPGFEQDIWDMVYDEGVEGASGDDQDRLEALCDEWKVPEGSLACRKKVKVLPTLYSQILMQATLTDTTLDQVLQCAENFAGASKTACSQKSERSGQASVCRHTACAHQTSRNCFRCN
jgi:hypothetical protein